MKLLSRDLDLDLFKAILFSSTFVSSSITFIQTVFFNIASIYIHQTAKGAKQTQVLGIKRNY